MPLASSLVRPVSAMCALAMVLLAFQVLTLEATASASVQSPMLMGGDVGGSDGGGGSLPPGGRFGSGPDGLLGDDDPNGTVNDTFVQPLNTSMGYANHTLDPYVLFDGIAYVYVTSFGNYTFRAATPHAMTVYDLEDRLEANYSSFLIVAEQPTEVSGAYVGSADNTTFAARYNVTAWGTNQGVMEITTVFNATALPKLSALYTPEPGSNLTGWRISWRTMTPSYYLKASWSSTMYFGDLSAPAAVATPNTDAAVGPTSSLVEWNYTLWANWSDAGTGSLSVGPVVIGPLVGMSGKGILVDFPVGQGSVDPSLVATTVSSYGDSTAYTTQKKVFYFDNRYYAFYNDGSWPTSSIRYAVGQEVQQVPGNPSAQNSGIVWGPGIPITSWAHYAGFDVDVRNGIVALVWRDPYPVFMRGTIGPWGISWGNPGILWGSHSTYPPTIAVGFDGIFWIATAHGTTDEVWRWDGVTGFFSLEDTVTVSDGRESLRIVPLPSGSVRLVAAHFADSEVSWRNYDPVTEQWFGCLGATWCTTSGADLPAGASKLDRITATWRANGDVTVAFVDSRGALRTVDLHHDSASGFTWIEMANSLYPAIQRDGNDDLHLFWAKSACLGCTMTSIKYKRLDPAGWMPTWIPFAPMTGNPVWLSAGLDAGPTRAFVVFSNPMAGGAAQVYFASVPTRHGGGASGELAWSLPGVNPTGLYVNQLGEYVSPTNGVLYLKATDILLPGRILDLSIQRLYRTPEAFGHDGGAWDFEEIGSPYYSMGTGWSLNFPWLTDRYLYLWDGQRYAVKWEGNRYESQGGEYFVLDRYVTHDSPPLSTVWVYLRTRSGTLYRFLSTQGQPWRLRYIQDPTAQNTITFDYTGSPLRLTSITDTVGRTATLDYTQTAYCPGASVSPPKVCKITYGGRTVEYRYSGTGWAQLTDVIDPRGPSGSGWTHLYYCYTPSPCGGVASPRLVRSIVYPTNARTEYVYGTAKAGTDLNAYLVVTQKLEDSAGPGMYTTTRKKTYSYDVVNGVVAFNRVGHYASDVDLRGYSLYSMDPTTGSLTVTQVDAANNKLTQQRLWFGRGGVVQADAYMGANAIGSGEVTYSTYAHYDDYGNVVYTRSPTGQETFRAYANSNNRSAFFGPGRMTVSTSGKFWSEDFRDRDASDWTKTGKVELDAFSFGVLPPSLKAESTATQGTAIASRTFAPQSNSLVLTAMVRMRETTTSHWVLVKAGSNNRAWLEFDNDHYVYYPDGPFFLRWGPYVAGKWYSVAFEFVSGLSSYSLWIDGVLVRSGLGLLSTGAIDTFAFQAGYPGSGELAATWVNEVAAYATRTVTVLQGIPDGAHLRVLDARTGKRVLDTPPSISGSASFTLPPGLFPRITIQVLDAEWTPIYTSPSREYWGGSSLVYVRPTFISGLTKTSSGFLRYTTDWVDDSFPADSTPDVSDYDKTWKWVSGDNLQASLTGYHQSAVNAAQHYHGFKESEDWQWVYSGEYNIQYVYLRSDAFPAEVQLQYQSTEYGGNWDRRAFWGYALDTWRDLNGSWRERWMGFLPPITDRWIMLIVKQDDIAPSGSEPWTGMRYLLVGGDAKWDVTSVGDSRTGQVRVTGIPPWGAVTMQDRKGHSWSATDTSGTGTVDITVYSVTAPVANAFPLSAKFRISGPGIPAYDSPFFDNVFGGDVYTFTSSNFDDNSAVYGTIHDRLTGVYQVQTGSVVQETYFQYSPTGQLLATKVRSPSSWWTPSSKTYDSYGNVQTASSLYDDTHVHATSYEYSATYHNADLTKVTDTIVGGPTYEATFSYDASGITLSTAVPPKLQGTGQATSYQYDILGRVTRITHPDNSYAQVAYYDAYNLVVLKDENYGGSATRQTWECYDSFGNLREVARFGDLIPQPTPYCIGGTIPPSTGYDSKETYAYNWQGQVEWYTSAMGKVYHTDYDFLGRVTRAWNADQMSWTDVSYDDATNTKTVTVATHKTQYVYDWDNRLTKVRQFRGTGQNEYYEWTYTYDNVGNLKTVTSPPDSRGAIQVTSHTYDRLNRLTRTDYPDGTYETFQYYKSGSLSQKQDRMGFVTSYTPDELGRPRTVSYARDGLESDYAYDPNGNLEQLKHGSDAAGWVILDYTYDSRDRMLSETYTMDGTAYPVGYTYDNAGNVLTMTYPSSPATTAYYQYDAFNRACAVAGASFSGCNPTTYFAKLTYYKDDRLDTITYGNTFTTIVTYNANAWPYTIETKKDATSLLKLTYSAYDTLGDPTTIQATGMASPTPTTEYYVYDPLGRLTTTSASGSWSWYNTFGYDALGDRTSMIDGGLQDPYVYYTYDSYSRLCRVGTTSEPLNCNAAGDKYYVNSNGETNQRIVGGTTWNFGWGSEGRLASISKTGYSAAYTYDGAGRRVDSAFGDGTETYYVFSGLSPIFEKTVLPGGLTVTTRYIFANGMRLASLSSASPLTYYYHYDHLGNVRLVSDSTQQTSTVYGLAYRPFGGEICVLNCGSPPALSYRYTGEYREGDPANGPNLYYLGSRWYDPIVGRFLSPDDRLGRLSTPQDQNRYAYVMNNPMAYTDPTGHFFWFIIAAFLIAGSISTVAYAATCQDSCSLQGAAAAFFFGGTVGALGAVTFGAALYGLGAAGLGTALAGGGYVFTGLCGAAAFAIAGAVSGAVANVADYVIGSVLAGEAITWEGIGKAALVGGIVGGITAGVGYGIGRRLGLTMSIRLGPAKSTTAQQAPSEGAPTDPEFTPEGLRKALSHELPSDVSTDEFLGAARRAANEQLSLRTPSSRGGPGYRAYGPLSQKYGVLVVVEGDKIVNAWPIRLSRIARYLT